MQAFAITIERHHSVENNGSNFIADAENETEALIIGLANALDEMYSGEVKAHTDKIRTALAEAAKIGEVKEESKFHQFSLPDTVYGSDEDEGFCYEIWDYTQQSQRNTAIRPYGSNKYETRWIRVKPWQPDEDKRHELLQHSKEELAEMVLRLQEQR